MKLGIDIGGTKVNAGLLDEQNRLLAKKKFPVDNANGPAGVLADIKRELDTLLADAGHTWAEVEFCGIGVPGTVSADGRTVVKAPNLGWYGQPIADLFTRLTGLPARLVQDSRAAAWGEYMAGGGVGRQTVLCFTLGTGIGTGIVMDGKIYHGARGSAGEIGHNPVAENGRPCGCGKTGCLEKYAAGLGFEKTAAEVFGEPIGVKDLFDRAAAGDSQALQIISDAVQKLGAAIVGAVNLLSPDCVLLSGGMSRQTTLFAQPLIDYIRAHCYTTENSADMVIAIAKLGEDAPLYGAALLPHPPARPATLSPSVMCADLFQLKSALQQLDDPHVQYLHCDVMDGHFVPNLMLPPAWINQLKTATDIPLDIHLMADNPELIIPMLDLGSRDVVSVHMEGTRHINRILSMIRERGAQAAVAVNPGTPIESIRETLNDIAFVLLMTVNPGFAGQKLVPGSFDKIRRTRRYLDSLGYTHVGIQVDGNCSFENIVKMRQAGADIFVGGTSSIFHREYTIPEAIQKIYDMLGRMEQ